MSGNNQKNRTDGVNSAFFIASLQTVCLLFLDLKKIFQHNHKSQNLKVSLLLSTLVHFLTVNSDALKDGAYHSIFEALFKVARAEKQAYLIAKNAAQKTKAEQVLSACSDVLRMTIRAGAEKLKPKTVKAVIEHVTQLLPVADGEHCAGLSKFYFKVLCSVLEHEAHVEHLEGADWLSTVDYCLQGIEHYGSDCVGEAISSSRNIPSVITPASFSGHTSSTKLSVRSLSDANSSNSITKKNSEELLQCLLYLISASNAPILERAEDILEGIMHFLESHGTFVGPVHRVAFSAINHMLSATNTDKISLSQSCALRLVPIIGHLWLSKILPKDGMLNSIKDEMLITILLLRLHLERMVSNHENGLESKLEDLETALRMEYTRHRDQLQLDDLDMSTLSGDVTAMGSLPIGMLRLRNHASPGAERNWAILAAFSVLDGLLHVHEEPPPPDADGGDGEIDSSRHPRKRRRITRRFDGLLDRITSQDFAESVVALQTLTFLLPSSKLPQQELDEVLERLAPCIVDRRSEIGSWAMLCIAR
jgi:serine-protein kinase ATM